MAAVMSGPSGTLTPAISRLGAASCLLTVSVSIGVLLFFPRIERSHARFHHRHQRPDHPPVCDNRTRGSIEAHGPPRLSHRDVMPGPDEYTRRRNRIPTSSTVICSSSFSRASGRSRDSWQRQPLSRMRVDHVTERQREAAMSKVLVASWPGFFGSVAMLRLLVTRREVRTVQQTSTTRAAEVSTKVTLR